MLSWCEGLRGSDLGALSISAITSFVGPACQSTGFKSLDVSANIRQQLCQAAPQAAACSRQRQLSVSTSCVS